MPISRPTGWRRIALLLLLLLLLAALGSCALPRRPAAPKNEIVALERRMFDMVNEHRIGMGLPRLEYDPLVSEIARSHSRGMARGDVRFGHRGFHARARAIRVFRRSDWISENVAYNLFERGASPGTAVKGLLGSAKHRRNMEGVYHYTGVGVARSDSTGAYYYTQLFVR
jgi:uncharacterized protein YkwD